MVQVNTHPDNFLLLLDTSVALLGNAFLESSYRRRALLKMGIHARFHSLCSTKTPITNHLFGDNMLETAKTTPSSQKDPWRLTAHLLHLFYDCRFVIGIRLTVHINLLQSPSPTKTTPTTPGDPAIRTAQHPITNRHFRRNTAVRNDSRQAGNGGTKNCLKNLCKLTHNKCILSLANCTHIYFNSGPFHRSPLRSSQFDENEVLCIDDKIGTLMSKGTIIPVMPTKSHFICNIFTWPKKSGGFRTKVNLKKLNRQLKKRHF